jgi:hypothetical protein
MRCCIVDSVDGKTVAAIQRVVSTLNSFVEMSLRGGEFIKNQEVLNVRLALHEGPGVDWQTNNSPTCNKVEAILLYDNIGAVRDIILHLRCGGLQRINDTHPTYVPLHFPLLFPHELVWHLAFRYKGDATNHKNNRVPCREFAAYRLHHGQCVPIAESRSKIISAKSFHTFETRLPSLPGSPGTSRLDIILLLILYTIIVWEVLFL